jgi:serine/threonine-protein kinase RsbW
MYNKVFPAELNDLYKMLEFIKSYGLSHNISSTILDQIILATEEALVNIISYGYPEKKKGTVEIICEKPGNQDGIKITIKDKGIPFNPIENAPSNLPSPSNILDKSSENLGGYGIYIITGLMDCVEYQRVNEGNILSLTKYFS